MNVKLLCSCLLIVFAFADAIGTGKPISGHIPQGNQIVDFVQYIYKGSPYFDLQEASIIAEIDTTDHSITLLAPLIAPPDSLYIRFVPSNLFTVTLSAEVTWSQETESYLYEYAVKSDASSVTPIGYFQIEWWNDYKEVFVPEGWTAGNIDTRRVNYWSNILHNEILSGDSLSGIGYESYGPPRLTAFEIWGTMKTIDQQGDDEYFGSIYSGISTKYRGVKGFTIAAWVSPESIEPVDWFDKICDVVILVTEGYLSRETEEAIYPILYGLSEKFQLTENQKLSKLEEEVNAALDALEPYREQMQPEAQAFIFENLRYILRHQDIVKFKEYP
jgi:hypothetical protein